MKTNKTTPIFNDLHIRIQVRLPAPLLSELNQTMLSNDYGLKGRSRWVEEAICFLTNLENFEDLVTLDETMHTTLFPCSFTLSETTKKTLEDALLKSLTKAMPEYRKNLSLSSIVRTAILQRLFRNNKHICPPGGQAPTNLIRRIDHDENNTY